MRIMNHMKFAVASILLAASSEQVSAKPIILNCHMGVCSWAEVVANDLVLVPDTTTKLTIANARIRSFSTIHEGDYPTVFSERLQISDETIGEVRAACSRLTPGLFDEKGRLTNIGVLQPYGYEVSARSLYFLMCHDVDANGLSDDGLRSLGYTTESRTEFASLDAVISANSSVTTYSELPFYYKVIDVAPNDVLNIRSAPNSDATIVGAIPYNASLVEITSASEDGRWFRVNNGEFSGWIRNRFLAPQKVPVFSNTDLPLELTCLSEEPFDTISFNFDLVKWTYQNFPDTKEMALKDVRSTVDPEGIRTTMLLASDGSISPVFHFREQMCSSSMVDENYPYSLFIEYDEEPRYFGCCTLMK